MPTCKTNVSDQDNSFPISGFRDYSNPDIERVRPDRFGLKAFGEMRSDLPLSAFPKMRVRNASENARSSLRH
jgi:hypothetical protein